MHATMPARLGRSEALGFCFKSLNGRLRAGRGAETKGFLRWSGCFVVVRRGRTRCSTTVLMARQRQRLQRDDLLVSARIARNKGRRVYRTDRVYLESSPDTTTKHPSVPRFARLALGAALHGVPVRNTGQGTPPCEPTGLSARDRERLRGKW